MDPLRDAFAAVVAAGPRVDLGLAALTIARIGHPALAPDDALARLDALAAAAGKRLAPGAAPAHAARELAGYLFGECGFRGNQSDYYDPRNSFLNDVLERRLGIPITLAVLLLEVGRRRGLGLEGVGFPGHFLVRAPDRGGAVLLDPFFGGRAVSPEELLQRYRAFTGANAGGAPSRLPADALAVTPAPAILARMLRNLLRIYLDRQEHAPALAAVDLLLVLVPDAAAELRVRGLLYEQLECFSAALADLRRYLELVPEAPDIREMQTRIAGLERVAAAMH
jgi:regulator of sirC expression with transglutaminase-like and TPR domain